MVSFLSERQAENLQTFPLQGGYDNKFFSSHPNCKTKRPHIAVKLFCAGSKIRMPAI